MEEQFRRHALEYRRASGRIRHTDQSLLNQRRKGSCTRAALSEWTSPSQRRRQRTLSKKSSREPISSSDFSTGWRVEARYDRAHGEGPTDLGAGHPDAGNQYQKTPKVPSRLDHSDRSFGYPNQVNNVLCFPFMFRGHSTRCDNINEEMKSAVVPAITELTGAELSDLVATTSGGSTSGVRPHYLILTPFDPRLIERIAPAVAKAAMDRGVTTRLPKHVARRELALANSLRPPYRG